MKKALVGLMIASVSAGAFANINLMSEQDRLEKDLQTLQTADIEGLATIVIDEETGYAEEMYEGVLTTHQTFVTKKQAKDLGLKKVHKQYLHSKVSDDFETFEAMIIEAVEESNPDYFNVALLRDYMGDTGNFVYIARITEYE